VVVLVLQEVGARLERQAFGMVLHLRLRPNGAPGKRVEPHGPLTPARAATQAALGRGSTPTCTSPGTTMPATVSRTTPGAPRSAASRVRRGRPRGSHPDRPARRARSPRGAAASLQPPPGCPGTSTRSDARCAQPMRECVTSSSGLPHGRARHGALRLVETVRQYAAAMVSFRQHCSTTTGDRSRAPCSHESSGRRGGAPRGR
jgi:hypothetical protein